MNTPWAVRPAHQRRRLLLAATAEKDDVLLLCVILNAEAYQLDDGTWYYGSFADAKALFEWAYDNFSYQESCAPRRSWTNCGGDGLGRRHGVHPTQHLHLRLFAQRCGFGRL
jgi:hypothetical protein